MEIIKRVTLAVWGERHKVLRFLFSGCTSAGVNFFFLYAFTEWAGMYYLLSVVVAFMIAVCVSFMMQKFWTFRDSEKSDAKRQATVYFAVAVVNTVINTGLVYLFVEYIHLHYMLGQFLASGIIAFESYFVYQHFIFKKNREEEMPALS